MSHTTDFIPVAKPLLGAEEYEAVRHPLESGWVTQGPEVAAFESEFAACVGAEHACAVSNCTTALHLALMAIGVQPGDEVITASHSFIATANAIRYCGAIPVFADIEAAATYNIDPQCVAEAITPKTRAILAVHQLGMPCDLTRLLEIARARKLLLVEDAACAIGSEINFNGEWEKIGRPHGDIACFSFHPRKVITTGDGGMITTNNAEFDQFFRLTRQHGMSVPDAVRHASRQVVFESYVAIGYNYRMTDIQAAVGRVQLKRLPALIAERREQADRYQQLLRALTPNAEPPFEPKWARSNFQSYCVRLPDDVDQRKVMQHMLDAGIATRRGVMCAHREPAYPRDTWQCAGRGVDCDCAAGTCRRLGRSEHDQDFAVILPLFPGLKPADQERVIRTLAEAMKAGST